MVNRVNLSLCLIVTQCLVFWFILPKFSKLFRAIHSNYDMLIAGWWEVGLRNRGICNIRYHDVSSSGSPFCSVGCCWVLKWTEIFLHTNTQGNLLGCWLKVVVLIVNRYVKPPIFTLCVGNAWGEAALLLAAGSKGNRACLPSATIMIKQVLHQRTLSPIDLDSQLNLPEIFLTCVLNMRGLHYFSGSIVYPGCCFLSHLLHLFNMKMYVGLKNNKHIFCACVRSISKLIFLQAVVVEGFRVLKIIVFSSCVISLLLSSVVKPPTLILLARKSGMWRPNWYMWLCSFLASRIQVTKFYSLSGRGDPLVSGCPSTH